jgi:hypothetical protein
MLSVRKGTVANVDAIGFVVRICTNAIRHYVVRQINFLTGDPWGSPAHRCRERTKV